MVTAITEEGFYKIFKQLVDGGLQVMLAQQVSDNDLQRKNVTWSYWM